MPGLKEMRRVAKKMLSNGTHSKLTKDLPVQIRVEWEFKLWLRYDAWRAFEPLFCQ